MDSKYRDNKECPCIAECKDCAPGFQKVIDLKNAGLIIYRHTTHVEDVDTKTGNVEHAVDTIEDVYILHNTTDKDISSADYWPEMEETTIKCPRCRKIKEHARKLLKKGPTIGGNEVKGICDHCKMKDPSCYGCQEAVKKFVPGQPKRTDVGKERVNHWLGKIKLFLDDTSKDKKFAHSDIHTNELYCNLKSPVREPYVEQLFGPHKLDSASTTAASRPSTDKKKVAHFPRLEKLEHPILFKDPVKRDVLSSLANEDLDFSCTDSNFSITMRHAQPEKAKQYIIKYTTPPNNRGVVAQEESLVVFEKIFEDTIPLTGTKHGAKTGNKRNGDISQEHGREKNDYKQIETKQSSITTKDGIEKKSIKTDDLAVKDIHGRDVKLPYANGQWSNKTNLKQKSNLHTKVKDSHHGRHRKYNSSETLVTKVKDITIGHLQSNRIIFPSRPHKKYLTEQKSSSELIKHTAEKNFVMEHKQAKEKIYHTKNNIQGETTDADSMELVKIDKHSSSAARKSQKAPKLAKKTHTDAQKAVFKAELDIQKADLIAEKNYQKGEKDALKAAKNAKKGENDALQAKKGGQNKALKGEMDAHKTASIAEKNAAKAEKDAQKAASIAEKTASIAEKNAAKAERDAQKAASIAEKKSAKAEKDAQKAASIAEKNAAKAKKEAQKAAAIAEKNAAKAEKDAQKAASIAEKTASMAEKNATKAEKDAQKAASIAEKTALMAEKNAAKAEKDAQKAASIAIQNSAKAEKDAQKAASIAEKNAAKAEKEALLSENNAKKAENQAKRDARQAEHKAQIDAQNTAEKTLKNSQKDKMKKSSFESSNKKTIQENGKTDNMMRNTKLSNKDKIKASLSEKRIKTDADLALEELISKLVNLKQLAHEGQLNHNISPDLRIAQHYIEVHCLQHTQHKNEHCLLCANSDLALEFSSLCPDNEIREELSDVIVGNKILKFRPPMLESEDRLIVLEEQDTQEHKVKSAEHTAVAQTAGTGYWRYSLSDRKFIDNGWTQLPTEKVVRKMNVYRMRPAHPEFDWFEHNKNKGLMQYDTGEKLAEFDDKGRGRWFYRNGRMGLVYYDAEEQHAGQRFVVYSNGEPDERGRSRPYTLLATFDYLGNGIVFDHSGKIRLKYNQTEGVVLDRSIGPISHWKWHTLNDPPVLQQVMIDTYIPHKDPDIMKMGKPGEDEPRKDDEQMLAIEFDNIVKEKSKKLSQTFRPFQIRMKALKINEHFSLRVLDQATVYLLYRDGTTNLKLNIGMVLDNKEIVDTETADAGDVSNNIEKLPARTESLAGLQKSIAIAQQYDRMRKDRERKLHPSEPNASVDKLVAGISRPIPHQLLTTVPSSSPMISATDNCKCNRKPTTTNVYYDTRFY